jgi:hypothetical protein
LRRSPIQVKHIQQFSLFFTHQKSCIRSAVTFWLPKSATRREILAVTFEEMARLVRAAKPETGLD